MNRFGKAASFLLILFGLSIITIAKLMQEFMIKIGYAIFKASTSGLYNPLDYRMELGPVYGIGTITLVAGVIGLLHFSKLLTIPGFDLRSPLMTDIRKRNEEYERKYEGKHVDELSKHKSKI